MTWVDVQDTAGPETVAVIPFGSTEQHGPHLPLSTDTRIAERLGEEIARSCPEYALVTPALPIGFSTHHLEFPGTLSARPETLSALLDDVVGSLERFGIRRFLILNGHGGNLAFLPAYCASLRRRTGHVVALVHWSMLGRDVVIEIAQSETYGHACEVETSLALALDPEMVFRDRIEEPSPPPNEADPLLEGHAIPERAAAGFSPRWFAELSGNGALGDPRLADEAMGHELLRTVRNRAVEFVRHLALDMEPQVAEKASPTRRQNGGGD